VIEHFIERLFGRLFQGHVNRNDVCVLCHAAFYRSHFWRFHGVQFDLRVKYCLYATGGDPVGSTAKF
jgi:hypothetical protein